MCRDRVNARYLPGVPFPPELAVTAELGVGKRAKLRGDGELRRERHAGKVAGVDAVASHRRGLHRIARPQQRRPAGLAGEMHGKRRSPGSGTDERDARGQAGGRQMPNTCATRT